MVCSTLDGKRPQVMCPELVPSQYHYWKVPESLRGGVRLEVSGQINP